MNVPLHNHIQTCSKLLPKDNLGLEDNAIVRLNLPINRALRQNPAQSHVRYAHELGHYHVVTFKSFNDEPSYLG